ELAEHGVVCGAEGVACREVQLEEPRAGLGVDRRQLDAERVERWAERRDELVVATCLDERVAESAREWLPVAVPDPDLVLEGRPGVVAEFRGRRKGALEDITRRQFARAAVAPGRRRQAHLPTR